MNQKIVIKIFIDEKLLNLYLGFQIIEKQQTSNWGSNFLGQLNKDLLLDFPVMTGFSKRNLELVKHWTSYYFSDNITIAKQVVSQ